MVSHKNKKGFTIVELLIVIVVIGILATLVIVTFTGIQQKARNTQRQTDIAAVQAHVESFYAEFGFYPNAADLNDSAFRTNYMKGLDAHALSDPKQANDTGSISATAVSATTYQYSYVVTDKDGNPCTATLETATTNPTDNGCAKYTLTANLEGGASPYTKSSN